MTYAIYQDTKNGLLRLGTFSPKNATSVREIARQFFARYPSMPRHGVYIARRYNNGHGYVDSPDRVPLIAGE